MIYINLREAYGGSSTGVDVDPNELVYLRKKMLMLPLMRLLYLRKKYVDVILTNCKYYLSNNR